MITAADNPRLKLVRGLLSQNKIRKRENRMVLEGVRLITDAIQANASLDFILYSTHANPAVVALVKILQEQALPCLEVDARLFADLADTQTPQGILAVCQIPQLSPPDPMTFALIVDGLADPGNMGTILRTAAAVGVHEVMIAPNTVDITNPKVVRSAMSAHFQVPIHQYSWDEIQAFNLPLWIADAQASQSLYAVDWTHPLGLIIGGEAHGESPIARHMASNTVRIPMEKGESLNAAMAASVILYEIYRQRHYR
jgi:TrmH family RNA methyltransferase